MERGTKNPKAAWALLRFSEEKPSYQCIPPESPANWKSVETNRLGACPVPRLPKSLKLLDHGQHIRPRGFAQVYKAMRLLRHVLRGGLGVWPRSRRIGL